ncbi:MAG: hypothetical protein AAF804_17820, partial [Bacteroidota bacterium]
MQRPALLSVAASLIFRALLSRSFRLVFNKKIRTLAPAKNTKLDMQNYLGFLSQSFEFPSDVFQVH